MSTTPVVSAPGRSQARRDALPCARLGQVGPRGYFSVPLTFTKWPSEPVWAALTKMSRLEQLVNTTHFFLTLLEAGRTKSMEPQVGCLARSFFLVHGQKGLCGDTPPHFKKVC